MRCNACWRELEGRVVTTTCGHLLCPEDANKILSNDGACPICDQVLSKSHMKPVDINPNDEWVNMAMAGVSPQILMKSAYRSVTFYIGQKDLEMQVKVNKIVGQCRQKCEAMQEKFLEKLDQIYTAYQKMTKRCQMMEQEIESLSKDKQELQEKFAEKCRQKRKLDEMYDLARTEIESLKRSAIQPANHCSSRQDPDLFSNPSTRMDNRDTIRKDWSVFTPDTPGPIEDMWPARQSSDSTFELNGAGGRAAKQSVAPVDTGNRGPHSSFGIGSGVRASNPSVTLRNLILSPIKRPQLSRSRPQLFTTELCRFSGAKIYPGKGIRFIRSDSQPAVATFLYGAAHHNRRSLDSIRRELGYFKPNADGNQWVGGPQPGTLRLNPDEGPRHVVPGKGVIVIGATDWVDNYNVPVFTSDMDAVQKIARRVSDRGGGLPSVQSMALAHGKNIIEVACNLLDTSNVGGDQVQREVEWHAREEGMDVGEGYYTDLSQGKLIENYLKLADHSTH